MARGALEEEPAQPRMQEGERRQQAEAQHGERREDRHLGQVARDRTQAAAERQVLAIAHRGVAARIMVIGVV
jgi:hypothetical protein